MAEEEFEILERLLEVIEPRQGGLPAVLEAEEAAVVAPRAVPPAVLADDGDPEGDDADDDDDAENDALTELIRSLETTNEQWLWQEHVRQEQARQRPLEARLHGGGEAGGRGVGGGGGGAGGGRTVGGGRGGDGGRINNNYSFFAGAFSIVANVYSCTVLALVISTVQPTCACVLFFGRVGLFALQRAAALDRRERRGAGEGRGGGGGDQDGGDAAARPRPRPGGRAFSVTRTDVCKGLFLLAAAGILIQRARIKKKREEKDKLEERKRSPRKNAFRASSALGALPSCTASGSSISCSYES